MRDEALSRCGISGIEAFILQVQLRWVGHVHRMPDSRIPKAVFYSELASGSWTLGRPLQRYRDSLKVNMQSADIDQETGRHSPAADRNGVKSITPVCNISRRTALLSR